MAEKLLEKYEALVTDMANVYLNNMARELGIKYRDKSYTINPRLSEPQHTELKAKHKISSTEYSNLYSEFQKMEPTQHMQQAMEAFTASGGSVEIDPRYDEETNTLDVSLQFCIKDRTLDRIEGLSPMEHVILQVTAMQQVDGALADAPADAPPPF